MADRKQIPNLSLLALAAAGLGGGLGARWLGRADWAARLMLAGAVPVLAAVLLDSLASLWRREVGLDIIALLSIGGALALGEYVSGRALRQGAACTGKSHAA